MALWFLTVQQRFPYNRIHGLMWASLGLIQVIELWVASSLAPWPPVLISRRKVGFPQVRGCFQPDPHVPKDMSATC